jgi:hypothetical protein
VRRADAVTLSPYLFIIHIMFTTSKEFQTSHLSHLSSNDLLFYASSLIVAKLFLASSVPTQARQFCTNRQLKLGTCALQLCFKCTYRLWGRNEAALKGQTADPCRAFKCFPEFLRVCHPTLCNCPDAPAIIHKLSNLTIMT